MCCTIRKLTGGSGGTSSSSSRIAAGPPVEAPIATQRRPPPPQAPAAPVAPPAAASPVNPTVPESPPPEVRGVFRGVLAGGGKARGRAAATTRTVRGRLPASISQLPVSSGFGNTSMAPRRMASKAVCIWLRLARDESTRIGVGRRAMMRSMAP